MGNKIGRRRQVVDEKYTRPQGLYQLQDIDHKKLRKLILDSKLAPCYPGDDEGCTFDLEECPICFLFFPSLNRSKCCTKGICTECFLQMKPSHSARPSQCPFCKTSNYAVEYRGAKTKEEKGVEQIEEQLVIEAKLRIQQQELRDEKGKLRKREKSSSSSRSLPQAEVEYQDVSGGSHSARCFRYLTQDDEAVSSQGSCSMAISSCPSHSRQSREDDCELDLENIMMMQAIWQSIQEQGGIQRSPSSTTLRNLPSPPLFSEECFNPNSTFSEEPAPSSSLACTMASLSEPAHMLEPSAAMDGHHSSASFPPEFWNENLGRRRWTMVAHGSNPIDAGTIYAGPDGAMGAGLSAEPLAAARPENFESQMMLSMAVSAAEAGARMSSQELMWL